MRWVEKISWNGSSYRLNTISNQGHREDMPVSALHDIEFELKSTRRIRVVSDFQTWRECPVDACITGMGFPQDAINGQSVYEFEADGKVFQVPATVLMKGLFRPLRGLAPHLFRPQGLDNLMVAHPDGKNVHIGFFRSPRTAIGICPARSEGTLAAFSWMYCFPSANEMWNSVLINARNGKLALALPEAKATLILRIFPYANKWLVTSLTVISLDTNETPFAFAIGHSRHIQFHQAMRHEGNGRPPIKQMVNLPSRNGNWHLSDIEWTDVEKIIAKGKARHHSIREMIDCILVKLGQGIPWKAVQYGNANQSVVIRLYQQMHQDGRWDILLHMLQKMRGSVQTNGQC